MRGVRLKQRDGRHSATTGITDVFRQARSHDYTNQQFCHTVVTNLFHCKNVRMLWLSTRKGEIFADFVRFEESKIKGTWPWQNLRLLCHAQITNTPIQAIYNSCHTSVNDAFQVSWTVISVIVQCITLSTYQSYLCIIDKCNKTKK